MAEHYCTEHKAIFFKKGKMRGYAHPIGDTGEWCNEPEGGGDPIPEEAEEIGDTTQSESKDKSMALSYAKDLAVADRIKVDAILPTADFFYRFITGGYDEAFKKTQEPDKPDTGQPSGKATKQELQPAVSTPQLEMNTAKELQEYLLKEKGAKAPGLYIRTELGLPPNTPITDEIAKEFWIQCKGKTDW